ncbi:MAG: EpsI family protein [Desulfobacterales bacterium]|nr:EpsI family protein [Desulfobacterales bacterium]
MENKSFLITILILLLAGLAAAAVASRKAPEVVETNLENIPMQIGDYGGTNDVFEQSVYDELNADKHVYRHYQSSDDRVVHLYIGYYGTAKGGRTGHNPYACLPGAGWGIVRDQKVQVNVDYSDGQDRINYTVTRKGDTYNVLLHWYQSSQTAILDSGFERNAHRFVSRIMKNRNDGAFVQVSTQVKEDNIDRAFRNVKSFAEKLLVLLPQYWPLER